MAVHSPDLTLTNSVVYRISWRKSSHRRPRDHNGWIRSSKPPVDAIRLSRGSIAEGDIQGIARLHMPA